MTKQHMTLSDRITIEKMLADHQSFKRIALAINKNCTTISREIRNRLQFKKSGGLGLPFNPCIHRRSCDISFLCDECTSSRSKHCSLCSKCHRYCPDFVEEHCSRLDKPPYVCNGCKDRPRCTLEKRFYRARPANDEYKEVLSESRTGISYSEEEIKRLDGIISPLVFKGQSINHICANNADLLMVSESTIYRLIEYNLFQARNVDLPRKVTYRKRRAKKQYKVDKACRIGRTYSEYLDFRKENPDMPVTEMDSVEGRKGGKVLLTIHFVKTEFMLAYIRDTNDSQSVIDIINRLCLEMRCDVFMNIMPLLLADNGSEFSNPKAIEFDAQGNRRTRLFYCDPSSPGQKGSAEKNHEFIRLVLPKGTSFDHLTQEDISLIMDHINSYSRESLGNKCPYEVFEFLYGSSVLRALGCHRISPNDVNLTPSLLEYKKQAAFQEAGSGQRPV